MATGIEPRTTAAVALVVLLLASDALGQIAPSRGEELFRQGRAAVQAGRYEEGLSLFEESQRNDPALGTLLNIAVCEERLGKLTRARAHLEEAHAVAPPTDRRRALIAQRLADLDRRMPRVTVRGPVALGAEARVTLDGQPIDAGASGDAIAVDPGTHLLSCAGKKGETCSRSFQIAEGQHLVQDLQPSAVVPVSPPSRPPSPTLAARPAVASSGAPGTSLAASPPPSAAPPARRTRRLAAYTLAGLGAVGIAASLIAGVGALDAKQEQNAHCDETGCDGQGLQAAARGDRWAAISTWSAIAGLASGTASLVLFATASSDKGGPPALAIGGTFR